MLWHFKRLDNEEYIILYEEETGVNYVFHASGCVNISLAERMCEYVRG